MKASFLTFFLVLIVAPLFGQTSIGDDDHYMYWRMRSRLRNHFVAVGYEKGANVNTMTSIYGIPAGSKELVEDPIDRKLPEDSMYRPSNDATQAQTSYELRWGDGPEQLGWYLGVLATEYRLLELKGAPIESKRQTMYELFCALKALERLERKAVAINFGFGSNNLRQGILIRDDISPYIFDHDGAEEAPFASPAGRYWRDGNWGQTSSFYTNTILSRSRAFRQSFNCFDLRKHVTFASYSGGPTSDHDNLSSKFRNGKQFYPTDGSGDQNMSMYPTSIIPPPGSTNFTNPSGYFFSPDHMIHLIMGMMLVRKYVPDGTFDVYNFDGNLEESGYDPLAVVVGFATRLRTNLHSKQFIQYIPKPDGTWGSQIEYWADGNWHFSWSITNPLNFQVTGTPFDGAKPISFQTIMALDRIINNQFSPRYNFCNGVGCNTALYSGSNWQVEFYSEASNKISSVHNYTNAFISSAIALSSPIWHGSTWYYKRLRGIFLGE